MKIQGKSRNQTMVAVATLLVIAVVIFSFIKLGNFVITGFAGQDSPNQEEQQLTKDSNQEDTIFQELGPQFQEIPQLPLMPEVINDEENSGLGGGTFVSSSGRGSSSGEGSSSSNNGNSENNPSMNNSNSNNNQTQESNETTQNNETQQTNETTQNNETQESNETTQNNETQESNETQENPPITSNKKKLDKLPPGLDLKINGNAIKEGEEFEGKVKFNLEKGGKKISNFDINFGIGDIDLSDIFGDSDFETGKSFMHHSSGLLEDIELYVPIKQGDVAVVVCSNASSYEEIYPGCSELPHITNEEVLYLPNPRVSVSADGFYYVVSGITGTGAMGANVSILGTSTSESDAAGQDDNAIAGNVTELNISAYSVTQSWQGYFGNVTGVIMLADNDDNVLYNWSLASPEGVILASTNQSIAWNHIQCFNFTATGEYTSEAGQGGTTSLHGNNLTLLEDLFNINYTDADGVDETFTLSGIGTHNQFFINNNEFSEGECRSTRIFSLNGAQIDDQFEEALLYEPTTQSVVFAGLMNDDVFGFDANTHDFEMLVLEDGHGIDVTPTTYYFYTQMY